MGAEVKLAAAEKQVTALKQQLEQTVHMLKLQSAADLPQSHRLYRLTSISGKRFVAHTCVSST